MPHDIFDATMRETRETFRRWGQSPARIVGKWMLVSFTIAVLMLIAVYIVSFIATPTLTTSLPNILQASSIHDAIRVFFRNSLVLALHGFVCLAGFMAMRALPEQAQYKRGVDKWVHEHAGPAAMVFVTCATLFSICTQIAILGHQVADLSLTLHLSQSTLMLTVLPHALLELTAVFLPLAAFLMASRSGDWHELLAATVVTVAIAIPMLIIAAYLEAYLWPETLSSVLF
jgi:uncharacterized membrane protein SpoIIM required for sporulation